MSATSRSHRVWAEVLSGLRPGHLTVILAPGSGLADGGISHEVPLDLVPPECRMPNSRLWVTMTHGNITKVEPGDWADLAVTDLVKQYPTRAEPLIVLDGISLSLNRGQNVAIVGPSGSGKSTFLFITGTLDSPTGGRVQIRGIDPFKLSEPELADFRSRNIGFVFQDHHLLPQCSVLENVLLPTVAQRGPSQETIDRARMLIERVGLTGRIDHRPSELSGGERQRVAVARALIRKPALLLADEPTGNLDRSTAAEIGRLLLDVHRDEQTMMIVVTHSSELAQQFDRRLELDRGRLAPTS